MDDLIAAVIFFVFALLLNMWLMPVVIALLKDKRLFLADINKPKARKVPALGGLACFASFIISIMLFVLLFAKTFPDANALLLGLLTISLVTFIGLVDDIMVFPNRAIKPVLVLFVTVPFIIANISNNITWQIPYYSLFYWGIFFATIFVPLAVVFASNSVNILAGLDGLVPGMTSVMSAVLLIVSYIKENEIGTVFFAILLATQLVLYSYNRIPSQVFPGNIGTLFAGAAIAVGAILAGAERTFIILMIPYAVHFILYSRNWFEFTPLAMGKIKKDGTLGNPHNKCLGLTHVAMKYLHNPTEKRIVSSILIVELFFAVFAVLYEIFKIPLL
jgi:UDP-N-acetylglucosamine--dolichyl-phosphate N-acetylglucosaminephosphotransferase